MRLNLSIAILASLVLGAQALVSCRVATPTTEVLSTSDDFTTSDDPGSNLPPVGRSLFDYVVAIPASSAGQSKIFDVPYPFDKLTAQIAAKSQGAPLGVLIPKGRSLQRLAAKPDFFKFPRAVVAVTSEPQQSATDLGMLLRDRIFIGHVETANALEVISYNEEAGRFEFQIVEDYKAGAVPKVRYAKRGLCVSCHQNQAPIFSAFSWQETNGEPQIATLINQDRPNDTAYLGIPIKQSRQIAYKIDNSTKKANQLLVNNKLWLEGCGDGQDQSVASPTRCRGDVLLFAVQLALTNTFDAQSSDGQRLSAAFKSAWTKAWSNGLKVRTPIVPNRNPLAAVTGQVIPGIGASNPSLSTSDAQLLKSLAEEASLPPEEEPLTPRTKPLEVLRADDGSPFRVVFGISEYLTAADRALLKQASGNDLKRISNAIDQMVAATTAGTSDLLAAKPFRRGPVVSELLKNLGVQTLPAACCDQTGMPVATAEDGSTGPVPPGTYTGVMAHFVEYCDKCHTGGQLPILAGNTQDQKWTSLKPFAKDIAERLDYEAATMPPMPPKASVFFKQLSDLQNKPKRMQMLEAVKRILAGQDPE